VLENEALDYETACRIRAYVKAVEYTRCQDGLDDETMAWIDWAKKNANWFDPTAARNDTFFGKRKHEKSEDQKAHNKTGQYL
jgi:hypothetical protein